MIELDFADEESVVQTRFATTELALLRAHLGHDIGAGRRTRPSGCWPRRCRAELLAARQFTFLGTGWTYGLASEAALKLREAAGMWTEAYPAMEYRHGPIAVTGPGSVVWLLGAAPDGLAAEIAAAGGLAWAATRTRWPSWSGCSGWRSRWPGPAGSTRTGRGTWPARSSSPRPSRAARRDPVSSASTRRWTSRTTCRAWTGPG